MKLILLSDLHIVHKNPVGRKDDLTATQFVKLDFIFTTAKNKDAAVVIAGDVFEKPRNWVLIIQMISFLRSHGVKVYSIFGQHDTYNYNVERRAFTNLGVLNRIGLVEILGEKPFFHYPSRGIHKHSIALYGCSYGQQVPAPLDYGERTYNILVIHKEIATAKVYPGHNFIEAEDFLEEHSGYDLILCGDVHRQFYFESKDKREIVNFAPMNRKTSEMYSFVYTPQFGMLNVDRLTGKHKLKFIDIPCEPPDDVLSRSHIENVRVKTNMMKKFIEAIKNVGKPRASFMGNLYGLMENADQEVVEATESIIESVRGKEDG